EWRDLGDAAVRGVLRDDRGLGPRRGLVPAEPRDPGVVAAQGAGERLDLAHVAAEPPQLNRAVEGVGPVAVGELLERTRVRALDRDPKRGIALAEGIHHLVRLLRQPPRRSEEHTSELQSRSDLVCRLLLEKKK